VVQARIRQPHAGRQPIAQEFSRCIIAVEPSMSVHKNVCVRVATSSGLLVEVAGRTGLRTTGPVSQAA